MERREFLRLMGGTAAASHIGVAQARRPNFLILLADDMGFSDAGCYGGEIETPNIDRLAAQGLRFTQGYSTARCGPSRSSLLTGYYAQQTASDVMTSGNVPNYTRFIPDYLKPLGYRTYHVGKWHIRFVTGEGGVNFDHSYTLMDEDRYFTPQRLLLDGEALPQPKPEDHYYTTTAFADYAVRFLQEHAREHAADPFFLYFAPHSPHFPLQAPAEDIERYRERFAEGWDVARERKWERMRRMGLINCSLPPLERNMWTRWNTPDEELYAKIGPGEVTHAVPWSSLTPGQKSFQRTKMAIHAAMITRMDIEIGRVLKQIQTMGADRDTVIFFLSDNGASSEQLIRGDGHDATAPLGSAGSFLGLGPGWSTASNTPLRLHKSWVNEGGIASPLIVHWPNGIRDQNKLRHDPCHFVDILPTVVDLAGGKTTTDTVEGAPPVAGRSLAAALQKDGGAAHAFLYFNHNANRALRVGNWKVISTGTGVPTATAWRDWELYDMSKDRCEMVNLAGQQLERVKQMTAQWTKIDDDFARRRESAPPTARRLMPVRGRGTPGR
jgi:arylsulfatase A-like enzyme